jgi:hypothetical protein
MMGMRGEFTRLDSTQPDASRCLMVDNDAI